MNKQEIEDGNKLIAEFMGVDPNVIVKDNPVTAGYKSVTVEAKRVLPFSYIPHVFLHIGPSENKEDNFGEI